jgi:3-oxoacyl-[acyl-carrier protein] reductase
MKNLALITGGTRGIGLGIAEKLAQNGFNLLLSGRKDESEIQETLGKLRLTGSEVTYYQGDISNSENRKALIACIKEKHSNISLLVNNAGVAPKTRLDILETTEESYEFVMDTNLKSQFFLSQGIANVMIGNKTEDAKIINISSVSATMASVNRAEYCISKAGIAMSTQLFALRLAEYGIGVYEVRPGIIKTDMTEGVMAKYDKLMAEGLVPQNRWGFPEDIGKAVLSIAKADWAFSTGNIFMVDGALNLSKL